MHYILLCLFSLLGSSPSFTFIKKKEWFPLVILNSDFALLNHRQITLPKYLEQITQEFFHFCLHEVASLKKFQQTWHVVHCTQTFAA